MSESSKEGRSSAKLDLDTYVSVSWCNDPARDITMEQFISLPKQQFDDVLYILPHRVLPRRWITIRKNIAAQFHSPSKIIYNYIARLCVHVCVIGEQVIKKETDYAILQPDKLFSRT